MIVLLLQDDGQTPLHKAAENYHLKIVENLLSKGAKVDSRDQVSTCNNMMSLGYSVMGHKVKLTHLRTCIARQKQPVK